MDVVTGNERSPIWARLDGVEREYKKLETERDQAVAERDAAREAWLPLLEQVDALRAAILAQLPKRPQGRQLSPKEGKKRGYRPSEEEIDVWAEEHESGMSINRIALRHGTTTSTVQKHLELRGVEVRVQAGHRKAVKKCARCNEPLDDGEEGVCTTCLSVDRIVAEHRERADA